MEDRSINTMQENALPIESSNVRENSKIPLMTLFERPGDETIVGIELRDPSDVTSLPTVKPVQTHLSKVKRKIGTAASPTVQSRGRLLLSNFDEIETHSIPEADLDDQRKRKDSRKSRKHFKKGVRASGNNCDDDSSSNCTYDEAGGMLGRRSESFSLVNYDKGQPLITKKEGPDEMSYDDTICSNRSSYFKRFFNSQPGVSPTQSMQSKMNWYHTSIVSLIQEKQRSDESSESKKKKPPLDYRQIAITLFLFLVICVMVSLIFYFYKHHMLSVLIFNRIRIVEKNRNLEVLNINEDISSSTPLVIVRLGVGFPLNARHTDCTQYLKYLLDVRDDKYKYKLTRKHRSMPGQLEIHDEFSEMQCIDYKGNGRLQLTRSSHIGEVNCFSVHWESSSPDVQMKDCFIIDNNASGTWWGMGDITGGSLPISKLGKLENTPLYTGEIQRHVLGGLIRRVWISSNGILVSVPLASQTVFSVNTVEKKESELCLASDQSMDVNLLKDQHNPALDYTICTGPNVSSLLSSLREVERMNEEEYLISKRHSSHLLLDIAMPTQEDTPDITEDLVEEVQERFSCVVWRPYLSHDESAIDQNDVVAYAEKVASSSFDACGHVLLPVAWQNCTGDLEFDHRRFPNPKLMVETLLRKGLRVALSLSPLIDAESPRFMNSSVTTLLVRQVNSTLPILVSTTRATVAGVLDFTNPNTIDWYASQLKKIKDRYAIDRFHVSPINTQSLPPFRQHYITYQNPDYALNQIVKAVSQIRPPISTDVAIIPVNTPTFLVAGFGDASWEMLEMLPNRILSISAVGGTLVDCGVVGGWSNQRGHIPGRELYIRWMEVSTFLPAMQFSVLPSMYDPMVETHANNLLALRKKLVIPRLNQNLSETLTNGYPLVTPLAIAFPRDAQSLTIGNQWMIGNDMMVAPILRKGRRWRDIYIPPGIWKDGINDRLLKGKRWLKSYEVLLGQVSYFFLMIPETGNRESQL